LKEKDAERPGRPAPDPASKGIRSTLIGVLANTTLAVVKFLTGIFGQSQALIADGMESTLDIFSSMVTLGGLRIAAAPPDRDHPYGHGKAEPLTAMVVSLTLMGVAVGLAIQSVQEILLPQTAPRPFTIFVLVGVILTKEGLYRFVIRVGEEAGSTAVKADAWHHRSDALTSLAAFLGISISLLGCEGYESADDWAALFACGIIAWNGYRLFRPALGEVMDVAPPPELERAIRKLAEAIPDVVEVEKCRVRKYGFASVVDIHVVVDGGLPVRRGHQIAHDVKEALCRSDLKIADVLVHIEPHD
jgi:cation diffusion facilitator family transporter